MPILLTGSVQPLPLTISKPSEGRAIITFPPIFSPVNLFLTNHYQIDTTYLNAKISTIRAMFVDTTDFPFIAGNGPLLISVGPFRFVIPDGFQGFIPLFINLPATFYVDCALGRGAKALIVLLNFAPTIEFWQEYL